MNTNSNERRIAWFISPHGFGHASRSSAIMSALRERDASIGFELFTKIPQWFFDDSLDFAYNYHTLLTDIGLVQTSPLKADLDATVRALNEFLPFDPVLLASLARRVKELNCELIVCDIAPLGIAVAEAANLPSVLIENFTWDWIYESYIAEDSRIKFFAAEMRRWFDAARFHIQMQPVCDSRNVDLTTHPVSRKIKSQPQDVRAALSVPMDAPLVLITMGGTPAEHNFLHQLEQQSEIYFVIPGGKLVREIRTMEMRGNLRLLPQHSAFFHPDLVNACDAVVGKIGYSTIAEIYQAGIPYGYVRRADFRESEMLPVFIEQHMQGMDIPETEFESGAWVARLPELLALPRIERNEPNGADEVANFIYGKLRG
jgi:hypothetical protein